MSSYYSTRQPPEIDWFDRAKAMDDEELEEYKRKFFHRPKEEKEINLSQPKEPAP